MEYTVAKLAPEQSYLLRKRLMFAFEHGQDEQRFTPEMLLDLLEPYVPFAFVLQHVLSAIEEAHSKGWIEYRVHKGLKRKEWFITPEGRSRDGEE